MPERAKQLHAIEQSLNIIVDRIKYLRQYPDKMHLSMEELDKAVEHLDLVNSDLSNKEEVAKINLE